MRRFLTCFLFFTPIVLLANHDGAKDFDILPRTINAVIFFGILYYLLKDFVVKAYKDRIRKIVSRLEAIENKLKESKDKKEESIKDLELAKNRAVNLVEVSKREAVLIKDKIKESAKFEMELMEKSYEGQKEFAQRKMTKTVVKDILDEVFSDESIKLNQKELIDIVQKKVS